MRFKKSFLNFLMPQLLIKEYKNKKMHIKTYID